MPVLSISEASWADFPDEGTNLDWESVYPSFSARKCLEFPQNGQYVSWLSLLSAIFSRRFVELAEEILNEDFN